MTTQADPRTGVLEDAHEITQREAVGLLAKFVAARDQAVDAKALQDGLGAAIREYLAKHPGEELFDGESGIRAALQLRNTGDVYDVAAMPAPLVTRLRNAHALKVDAAMVRALNGKDVLAQDVAQYKRPGGMSTALIVTEVKR